MGGKQPNLYGLYDLHGNVLEWVWDFFRIDYESLAPSDPVNTTGTNPVYRGGAWRLDPRGARAAARASALGTSATDRANLLGFRVARTLEP